MRKRISLLIVTAFLFILCACGAFVGEGESPASTPLDSREEKAPEEVILASSLISLGEAEGILETKLEALEIDKEMPGGKLQCVYSNDKIMLQIFITQNALMTELNLEYGGAKNTFNELVKFQKEESSDYIFEVGNIGEEAYFMDLAETNRWSLHILRSDHMITLHLDGDEEKEYIWEKLEEAGKLSVQNLDVSAN